MRTYLVYLCFSLCPLLFTAQDKKAKTTTDRLEIVGKWSSYSSKDSTKIEVVEFKPDGSFIEYKNNIPKHTAAKYVLYKDVLSFAVKEGKESITMKFRVSKESYGLFLQVINLNQKNMNDLIWVKLYPWKPN